MHGCVAGLALGRVGGDVIAVLGGVGDLFFGVLGRVDRGVGSILGGVGDLVLGVLGGVDGGVGGALGVLGVEAEALGDLLLGPLRPRLGGGVVLLDGGAAASHHQRHQSHNHQHISRRLHPHIFFLNFTNGYAPLQPPTLEQIALP